MALTTALRALVIYAFMAGLGSWSIAAKAVLIAVLAEVYIASSVWVY